MTLDELLGRGGATSFFTNLEDARSFVQGTINNNPRLTPTEKERLLFLEQEAVDFVFSSLPFNTGYVCVSKNLAGPVDISSQKFERECLQNYYLYLQSQFPLVTDDQRFLSIYDSAVEGVKAVNTSVSKPSDLLNPNRNAYIIGAVIIGLLLLRR
jgi:hypothetical protein